MFRSIFLLFACCLGHPLGALWAQNAVYEKITIENGLSQGMIFDICQTRDGFLWVATKDGLNRYDGYNFKVFANDPFDSLSIAENNATALFEDSRGWLWAGLNSKGVDVYDPKTGHFRHFPAQNKGNQSAWGSSIEALLETPDHSICALSRDGVLLRFAMPTAWKNGQPDPSQVAPPKALPMPPCPLIYPNSPQLFKNMGCRPDGTIVVFAYQMFYEVEPKTGTVRPLQQFFDKKLFIETIRAEAPGEELIWAVGGPPTALGESELTRFRNGKPEVFLFPPSLRDEWKRFSPGEAGHVWLTAGNYVFDLAPDETPNLSKPNLLFDVFPRQIKRDRTGNLWVGTIGYGMRKITPKQALFHAGAAQSSLEGVWENGGRYFVKERAHIQEYDPQTGRVLPGKAFSDASFWQINLAFEPSGAAWLLGREDSDLGKALLHRYAPGNTTRAEAIYPFEAKLTFFDPMFRNRDGHIWIGAHDGRLVHFDPRTERFDYFEIGPVFGEKPKSLTTIAIAEDAEGTLWVGTQLGLIKGTPKRGQGAQGFDFQLIQADPKNPHGLNNNTIACILPTPDGQIWLGTKGGGINILNPKTGECRHITTDDGLLNNVVYGILPGNSPLSSGGGGEFWCSTNRGLAKISLLPALPGRQEGRGEAVTTYTAALGLQDNEFNTQAFFKTQSGELLFGGINGLNRFFPESLRADTVPPPVFIVGIEINHKKSKLAATPATLEQLELSHDQNNISIEFAALDFTDPSKNRYRYRLVGLDADWVETGNHRFAHFNHLAPGKYTLRVQGNNGESAWREAKPLVIVVSPPWYRSNLAYLLYVLLLAWGSWRAYQFQIQRVKEREQLAFEQRETERVKVLEQLKTNFFSNVTHEFRTPLTLIIEPLRHILAKTKEPETRDKAQLAETNSRKLLGLVNQLLDMAKLESGQMTLDLRRGDLGQTVRDVFETFLPLAEKRGVKLTLNANAVEIPVFEFDPGKVELVLNNLISNALKFTPAGGKVNLNVGRVFSPTVDLSEEGNPTDVGTGIEIQISDTGIGIAPENLDKVFDRFYQVDGSHTRAGEGTGIGLALSKELAERMGGGIRVESELGVGSVFTFWLPIRSVGVTSSHPDTLTAAPHFEMTPSRPDTGFGTDASGSNFRDRTPIPPAISGESKPLALVVEDNADLRRFIKNSIGENWQVIEASDGEEGVKKAIELLPDLVVSDLMMPRKDGYALCDELKTNELTAHIPIILLTAKAAIGSKLKGLRTGADDYLTKPFSTEELLVRMENLLETRRRLRQLFGRQDLSLSMVSKEEGGAHADFLSEPDRTFLQKFTLLLEENLDNEIISVEDFAKKMLFSRSQLHRKLRALTDKSPTDFVRDYRLDRAHAMLKNREGRVGEVALRVGFGNEKYFSTAFREKFGFPPSQI